MYSEAYPNSAHTSIQRLIRSTDQNGHWNPEWSAVEFGVSVGDHRILNKSPTPERCVEAYHLNRTRFELIAERKLRRRQLTDDANVEITGRDLRDRDLRRDGVSLT